MTYVAVTFVAMDTSQHFHQLTTSYQLSAVLLCLCGVSLNDLKHQAGVRREVKLALKGNTLINFCLCLTPDLLFKPTYLN